MITKNTFGITFFLKKYKAKNAKKKRDEEKPKVPIYVRITVDGKRIDIAMKREIEIDNWNAGKGMTKAKSEEMRQLNTYLEQVRGQLVECYQELKLKNKLPGRFGTLTFTVA